MGIKSRSIWAIVILVVLNVACYYRTIKGYFLADDFIHVSYLRHVFAGHPDLLVGNFFTNWMQTEGTQFYRPFISITLAIDYLIWKANAVGFHITNLLFQTAASILLFLTSRRLLARENTEDATCAAFLVGAVFACYPLHAEVVSWVIGRVDSVTAVFYLLAFWLFLLRRDTVRKRFYTTLSLISFAIALASKEMAATLPLAVSICSFIGLPEGEGKTTFKQKALAALKETLPYWIMLVLYLIFRTLALGTIAGGYTGSIGQGLSSSLIKRLFEDGAYMRLFMPFNDELFGPGDRWRKYLSFVYKFGFALIAVRIFIHRFSKEYFKRAAFGLLWFFVTMLPTYQVWSLTPSLQGSRFSYLGSAPLAFLLVVLLYPWQESVHIVWRRASLAVLGAFVICFGVVAYKDNIPWAHASKGVEALRESLEHKLSAMPADKKIVLLNIPQRTQGAHMLYNSALLSVLLAPPLTESDMSRRVITFEPMMYGDADLIEPSRLRRLINDKNRLEFYRWNQDSCELERVNYPDLASANNFDTDTELTFTEGRHALSPILKVASPSIDFVDIDAEIPKPEAAGKQIPALILGWDTPHEPFFGTRTQLAQSLPADGKTHTLRFAVSEHKGWMLDGQIDRISLHMVPANCPVQIRTIRLNSDAQERPSVTPGAMTEDEMGVCRPLSGSVTFSYDASNIPNAKSVLVEASKPNSWFEHYTGTFRDKEASKEALFAVKETELKNDRKTFKLDRFRTPGYYELRVAALDENGKIIGSFSDPLNVKLSGSDWPSGAKGAL